MDHWIEDGYKNQTSLLKKVQEYKLSKNRAENDILELAEELSTLTNSNFDETIKLTKERAMLQCKLDAYDDVEKLEKQDLLDKMSNLTFENQKIKFWLENEETKNEKMREEVSNLEAKVAEEIHERETLHKSWKSTLGKVIKNNNDKLKEVEKKLKESEQREKDAQALFQQHILKVAKIPKLESELSELKKEHKRELSQQKEVLEAKIKALEDKNKKLSIDLKKSRIEMKTKVDDCPICFEDISLERKWTAFLPCGHRTCSECADKISHLPRATNRRKCPNCRENINCFLVLEGIYDS